MIKRNTKQWKFILIMGVMMILFTATTVLAQESTENPVAVMKADSTSLSWTPHVKYEGLLLTVSGPNNFYWQKLFEVGENLTFDAKLVGSVLPNGHYNYELLVLPTIGERTRDDGAGITSIDASSVDRYGEFTLTPMDEQNNAFVQTGAFTIVGGAFISEERSEIATNDWDPGENNTIMDQVILDDLIVDGSICAGFDCVNGESFGFDTIRFKENNLRIHFQDTSSTSSFPTRDWRIAINDSANGGASYFAIQDVDDGRTVFQIEAGAGSNALYIDDSGRVGLGTSTPAVELEIRDNDTPSVRLNQDGSAGWSPQTWDVASNEANFFIRDVTNGSQLPFRIQPGADSNALTIKSDNKVGIGTWSPAGLLHLHSNANNDGLVFDFQADNVIDIGFAEDGSAKNNIGLRFDGSSWGANNWAGFYDFFSNTPRLVVSRDGQVGIGKTPTLGMLDVNGDVYANNVQLTSDVNAKENFSTVDGKAVLASLMDVPISTWNFKDDETATLHMGPMAQDFSATFSLGDSDTTISLTDKDGVALAAIQGLNEIVMEKDAQIEELEIRMNALEKNNAPSQLSIMMLLPWLLLTIALVVLAFTFGKRQSQN